MMGRGHEQSPRHELEPTERWSFTHLQERVEDIYGEHDRQFGYGPERAIAKLQANAGALADNLEKGKFVQETIDRQLTNILIWTATFANQTGTSIGEVMEAKYGEGCPHCKGIPCVCKSGDQQPWKAWFEGTISKESSISSWQRQLGFIYPNNFSDIQRLNQKLAFAAQRIVDEAIELNASCYEDTLADLMQSSFQDNMNPVESELADVIAWTLAVANGLRIKLGDYSLEQVLIDKYKKGCPENYCGKPKCECPKEISVIDTLKATKETKS